MTMEVSLVSLTSQIEIVPCRSLWEVLFDVDCPLVVTPALFPGLEDGLLQIHHLHLDWDIFNGGTATQCQHLQQGQHRRRLEMTFSVYQQNNLKDEKSHLPIISVLISFKADKMRKKRHTEVETCRRP